jgi:hypothetical protein
LVPGTGVIPVPCRSRNALRWYRTSATELHQVSANGRTVQTARPLALTWFSSVAELRYRRCEFRFGCGTGVGPVPGTNRLLLNHLLTVPDRWGSGWIWLRLWPRAFRFFVRRTVSSCHLAITAPSAPRFFGVSRICGRARTCPLGEFMVLAVEAQEGLYITIPTQRSIWEIDGKC